MKLCYHRKRYGSKPVLALIPVASDSRMEGVLPSVTDSCWKWVFLPVGMPAMIQAQPRPKNIATVVFTYDSLNPCREIATLLESMGYQENIDFTIDPSEQALWHGNRIIRVPNLFSNTYGGAIVQFANRQVMFDVKLSIQ